MALEHISHSQLSMWQKCPRQWEYAYVEKIKTPPSGPLIEGSCYHGVLEENFKQKITSKEDIPVEMCLDIFSDMWEREILSSGDVDWGNSNPGAIKDQGCDLIDAYMRSTAPSVQPIEVERMYSSRVGATEFVCRVDLIDTMKKVIDHKTSSRAYTQDGIDKDIQAGATAFVLNRPIIYRNHVAIKQKSPRIQILETARLWPDIRWWLDMATGILEQMMTGIAPPRPYTARSDDGWYCSERFCGYFEMCRGELTKNYF